MIAITWILWNFFLASIPVAAAYLLIWAIRPSSRGKHRVPTLLMIPLAALWLAFLPNTCYLLTEWRHFLFDDPWFRLIAAARHEDFLKLHVARWVLFFGFYSGFGVITFVLAVRPIDRYLQSIGVRRLYLALPFFFLMSLGVYLGLMDRLNSWQIVTHPWEVWGSTIYALSNRIVLATILAFAVFLWLLYEVVNTWVDGVSARCILRSRGSDPEVVMAPSSAKKGKA